MKFEDSLSEKLEKVLLSSNEHLETKEIEHQLKGEKGISRVKVLYRLGILRGDGKINGKIIGSGKGVWIWWARRKEVKHG